MQKEDKGCLFTMCRVLGERINYNTPINPGTQLFPDPQPCMGTDFQASQLLVAPGESSRRPVSSVQRQGQGSCTFIQMDHTVSFTTTTTNLGKHCQFHNKKDYNQKSHNRIKSPVYPSHQESVKLQTGAGWEAMKTIIRTKDAFESEGSGCVGKKKKIFLSQEISDKSQTFYANHCMCSLWTPAVSRQTSGYSAACSLSSFEQHLRNVCSVCPDYSNPLHSSLTIIMVKGQLVTGRTLKMLRDDF